MTFLDLRRDFQKLADPQKAKILARFFKTGKGEYGYGDIFLGITVPKSRVIALKYKDLPLNQVKQLLESKIHEERLIALLLLVNNFLKGSEIKRKEIFDFYLRSIKYVNNWDLVDLSAPKIVGAYLQDQDKTILLKLAKSPNLWEKRIAILATFYFIRFNKDAFWTFKITEILLKDPHDLIHKAVGWMLREVGKNISQKTEESFLEKHYKRMPRTMLRYAIENFPDKLRIKYLQRTSVGKGIISKV